MKVEIELLYDKQWLISVGTIGNAVPTGIFEWELSSLSKSSRAVGTPYMDNGKGIPSSANRIGMLVTNFVI